MRKLYLLLPIILFIGLSCGDEKEKEIKENFIKTFGGSNDDYGSFVQQTTDGGYIIIGSTVSFGSGERDVWLIKTDSNGNQEWEQIFGGISNDYGSSVQQTSDGGYIVLGSTNSFGNGIYLIKTDSIGDSLWSKIYDGSSDDYGTDLQQTTDGGYIIIGRTLSFDENSYFVWLIKTDSDGTEVWNKTLGGNNGDWGSSVQQTTDGGYIIIGRTWSYGNGGSDVLFIKTDSEGNTEPYGN